MKIRYFWPFAVSIFLILGACSNNPSIPKGFPKEAAMANILADLYLAESTMNSYPFGYKENMDFKSAGYYKDVLAKHHLTKQQFDTILAWYTSEPYLYTKVYDRVISILGAHEAQLKNTLMQDDSLKKLTLDSLKNALEQTNLWLGAAHISLPKRDTISTQVAYELALDSVADGIVELEARYGFGRENQSSKAMMLMKICYADSTCDSTRFELERSFQKKISKISITIPEGKMAVLVKGSLLEYDTLKNIAVDIDAIRLSHLPKGDETLPKS